MEMCFEGRQAKYCKKQKDNIYRKQGAYLKVNFKTISPKKGNWSILMEINMLDN